MRRLSFVITFAMVITTVWSARADALGTPDQQQPIIDSTLVGAVIGGQSNQKLAQVVTAGLSGPLTEIDLPVSCDSGQTLTVEIRSASGGFPGSTVLASTTASPVYGGTPAFVTLSFGSPATISAGQQFAIFLSAAGATGYSCGIFQGPVGDPYSRGDLYYDAAPNQPGWVRNCTTSTRCDLPFKTYVAQLAEADLGVSITSVPTSVFGTTQLYRYEVTLTNYGPAVPSYAGVTLTPSSNLRIDGYPIAYCSTTPAFNCGVSNLGVNQSMTFNIFVTAQFGLTASMGATTQSSLPDLNHANNNANGTTVVNPVVDMTVQSFTASVTGSMGPGAPTTTVGVGDDVLYTVVVKNNSNYDAHAAGAVLPLPTGTTFVGIFGPPGAVCGFDAGLNAYGCNFGTLTPTSTATLWLEVRAPSLAGTLLATATARANEPDSDPANDAKTLQLAVVGEMTSGSVAPGGSVTTNTGSGATATDPVETTATSPSGGTISIREVPTTAQNGMTGYNLMDQQVIITAPPASASAPVVLVFEIDKSKLYPPTASTITIFRNGVAIGNCPGQTTASPDPCVSDRTTLANGNVRLTVLTSAASRWNFGIHVPYSFAGFFEPLDGKATAQAGSTIPVKFSLGGNQGPNVVASAESRSCAGGAAESIAMPGSAVLKYDTSTDRYQLNWKTTKDWAGTCRELAITLMDGSVHSARVSFR